MNISPKNRIYILINKKLSNTILEEEEKELLELFENDPDAWFTFEVLNHSNQNDKIQNTLIHEVEDLLKLTNDNNPKNNLLKQAIIVVACILIVSVSLFYIISQYRVNTKHIEIIANNNTILDHTLPDGTRVKLNSGSTLRYSKTLSSDRVRTINLEGEAYFKVTSNAQKPFKVITEAFIINNIGTEFNVKAYKEDNNFETTLIEGAVKVELIFENTSIVLKPLEKIIYNKDINNTKITNTTVSEPLYRLVKLTHENPKKIDELAWLENGLIFKNQTFEEITKKLERRYNITIMFNENFNKNCLLTGSFKNENIEECLNTLQKICAFSYKVVGNSIYIEN